MSVQLQPLRTANQQVSDLRNRSKPDHGPRQVSACGCSTSSLIAPRVDAVLGRHPPGRGGHRQRHRARGHYRAEPPEGRRCQGEPEAGRAGRVVTILEGDALERLAGLTGPVGLVLLDGWKD